MARNDRLLGHGRIDPMVHQRIKPGRTKRSSTSTLSVLTPNSYINSMNNISSSMLRMGTTSVIDRSKLAYELGDVLDRVPDPLYVPTLVVGVASIYRFARTGEGKTIFRVTGSKLTNDMWSPISTRTAPFSSKPIYRLRSRERDFDYLYMLDERAVYGSGYSTIVFCISRNDAQGDGRTTLNGPSREFVQTINVFLKGDGVSSTEGFPSMCRVEEKIGTLQVLDGIESDRIGSIPCVCFKTTISSSPATVDKLREYDTYSLIMDMT